MATPANDKRERARKLIHALTQKTVAKGCTEQEALLAATKVNQLLIQFDLSLDDVADINDGGLGALMKKYGKASTKVRRKPHFHETQYAWKAIGRFTNTRVYYQGDLLVYFGSKLDGELAFYFVDLVCNAGEAEWKAYKRTVVSDIHVRSLRKAFFAGFANRIVERLDALTLSRQTATAGNALVVVRNQLIDSKLAEHLKSTFGDDKLKETKSRKKKVDAAAYRAGDAAGNRTAIVTAVDGQAEPVAVLT